MAEKQKKSNSSKKGSGSKSTSSKESESKQKVSKIKTFCYSAIAVIVVLIVGIFADNDNNNNNTGLNNSGGSVEVHYIDVRQGDCIFIESEGQNMLIDCGESSESDEVTAYLQEHNISRINYLVGTHAHSDHMGGMSAIVDNFEIDNFYMPYISDDKMPTTKYFEKLLMSLDAKGLEITNPEVGDKINIGDAEILVVAPNDKKYSNTNNYSIGLILTHGDNSFIFTGDAETMAEKEMIDNGLLKDINVYKAGHHGSSTSSSEEFLDVIKPEYAVIMCGTGNSYGHPNDDALQRIGKYVSPENLYRTDLYGSIVVQSDGSSIKFTTERQ